jgi:[ribosomal protein S5]-alanine N-acetyltransferase
VTAPVEVLSSPRLKLRHLSIQDAAFILELLNEKPYLENIGDRGVRNLADAGAHILDGPLASYRKFGFGLYAVERKEPTEPIGICGLLKREYLNDVDLGFAFLQKFWGQGYALESAEAVMHYARVTLGLQRILATTKPHNRASEKLLTKLGFRFEKMIQTPQSDTESKLFSSES